MRMRALLSEFESDIKRRAYEYDLAIGYLCYIVDVTRECRLEEMGELEYECFWDAYLDTNVSL